MALDSGTHIITIDKPTELQSFLDAENGIVSYSSDIEIGKLYWKIKLYPKGMDVKRNGSVDIWIKLLKHSFPSSWKSIHILCTIMLNMVLHFTLPAYIMSYNVK